MKFNLSFTKLSYLIHIIFLIVLQNFAMDSGMGFFGISAISILLIYIVFVAGLKPGISKMVNSRLGNNFNGGVSKVLKYGLLYAGVLGFFVILSILFFSDPIMQVLYGNHYVAPVLYVLAVCFLLNALLEAIMGYYKGTKNDGINKLLQILKCIFPILLSFGIIHIAKEYGTDVAKLLKTTIVKNAYVAMGIAFVYMFSLLIVLLVAFFFVIRNQDLSVNYDHTYLKESKAAVFANFIGKGLRYSINHIFPLLCISFSGILYLWISNKYIGNSNISFNLFGVIFSRIFLPFAFVMLLFSEYYLKDLGKLRSDYRKSEKRNVILRCQHYIKNTFLILIPVSVFFTFFSDPFVKVFFTANYKISSALVQKAGFLVLFIGLAAVLIHLLKSVGKEQIAIGIQTLGFFIQIVSLILMLNHSNANVNSLIYALYINCLLQILLSFPILFREIRMNLVETAISIGKYFIAALVMTLIFVLLDRFISMNPFLILLSIVIGYLIYFITLIALKGLNKSDVLSLKGSIIHYPIEFLSSRLKLW